MNETRAKYYFKDIYRDAHITIRPNAFKPISMVFERTCSSAGAAYIGSIYTIYLYNLHVVETMARRHWQQSLATGPSVGVRVGAAVDRLEL